MALINITIQKIPVLHAWGADAQTGGPVVTCAQRSSPCKCAAASVPTCLPTWVQTNTPTKLHSTFSLREERTMYLPTLLIQGSSWEIHCTCSTLGLTPHSPCSHGEALKQEAEQRKIIVSGIHGEVKYLQKVSSITLQQKGRYIFVRFAQH